MKIIYHCYVTKHYDYWNQIIALGTINQWNNEKELDEVAAVASIGHTVEKPGDIGKLHYIPFLCTKLKQQEIEETKILFVKLLKISEFVHGHTLPATVG